MSLLGTIINNEYNIYELLSIVDNFPFLQSLIFAYRKSHEKTNQNDLTATVVYSWLALNSYNVQYIEFS